MTTLQQAETILQNAFEKINAPSMIGAIIHHGQLHYVLESGDATPNSRFRLGTLTQVLTAYAILQHLTPEQLHQPVDNFLTSFKVESPTPITPHALLTHTSGLGAARSLWTLVKNDTVQSMDKPITDLKTHYNGTLKATVKTGEKWCYSHDNYAVLGQILSDIHQKPYQAVMEETIFQPLGMTTTFNTPTLDGYKADRRTKVQQQTPLLSSLGACASLNDLIALVGALFQTPLITATHYQTHPQLPAMGYGLRLQTLDNTLIGWINGQIEGFSSALYLAPETQTAVILLANITSESLFGSVARQIILNLLDINPAPPQPAPTHPNLNLKGYYAPSGGLLTNIEVWNAYGGGLTISQRGGKITVSAQIDPTVSRVVNATPDPNLYYFLAGKNQPSWMAITFDAQGNAQTVQIGLFTFHRRPYIQSLGAKLMIVILLLLFLFFMIVLSIL